MAWDVEVNQYMNLAVVTLWGRVTVAEREQALDTILERMDPDRDYRVLVDLIGAQPVPDGDHAIAEFARRLAGVVHERGWRLAYLYPAGSRAHQLVEQLACASDLAFRRFNAVIDAMDWLLAPGPRPIKERQALPIPPPAVKGGDAGGRLRRWFG